MPPSRDLTTVLEAAEAAAVAGDFAAAANELRDALEIQEATLGPAHPDLADTLNNLGVASERAKRLDDAERYYRRALAVATAAFPADHPFVATSRANLREFCEANGRPVEEPPPAPPKPAAATPAPAPKPAPTPKPAPRVAAPPPPPPSPPPPSPSVTTRSDAASGLSKPVLIGAVILILVVIAIVYALRGESESTTPPGAASASAPPPTAAAPPPAPAAERPAAAAGSLSLVNARLCRRLDTDAGEWNCERATSPVAPGSLTFLTRVKSARDTTVQHRWFRGQELVRNAQLRITANPTEGYRTYSRYQVSTGADWRVELRAGDGTLLHEERFAVK